MKLRKEYDVQSDEERIKIIADLVYEGSKSPVIRELSHEILNAYGVFGKMGDERTMWSELEAIYDWVKRNIAYRSDTKCVDSFHTAERILKLRAGDCDDHTILVDSLLAAQGWTVGARIVSKDILKPYHHIYAITVFPKNVPPIKGKLVPLDTTIPSFRVGEEVNYAKKRDFLFLCKP